MGLIERAAATLESFGAPNFTIRTTTHVVIRGTERPGVPWPADLAPWVDCRLASPERGAVAVCGISTPGVPTVDPRSGRPLTRTGLVVVTGPHLALAAGYATGLWIDGPEGIDWFQRLVGFEGLLLLGGVARWTPSFPFGDADHH